jgi:sugar phosphate isomerase/epimerase
MRFAFCNEGFGDRQWPAQCKTLAEIGYDAVEIAPYTLADDVRRISAEKRSELRRTVEDAGLAVTGLHWLLVKPEGLHIAHPDAAVRSRTRDYLCALADFCADLGGAFMVFGSPRQRGGSAGASTAQAWDWAKETFGGTLATLAARNVTLCIDPLAATKVDPSKDTDFLNTAAEARRFVEDVNHPNVRLILDARSMSYEDRPIPDLLRENADILAHVHANDRNGQAAGFGEVDFRPILAALQEIGYTGYVSSEPFEFAVDIDTIARKTLEYLRSCLAA